MATESHGILHHRKGMGLVHEVFTQERLESLRGSAGIGHVRYSTTGRSDLENAQPLVVKLRDEDAALAHNGDLVNFERVRQRLQAQGVELLGNADSGDDGPDDRARVRPDAGPRGGDPPRRRSNWSGDTRS